MFEYSLHHMPQGQVIPSALFVWGLALFGEDGQQPVSHGERRLQLLPFLSSGLCNIRLLLSEIARRQVDLQYLGDTEDEQGNMLSHDTA